MFHKLLSRTSVYLYMRGFRNRKKSCKINKDWQKRWSFYSKHVFQQTIYSLQKNHLFFQVSLAAWKVSKYRVTSGPYFPVLGLNTGKYGLEITPYLDTFNAVIARISLSKNELLHNSFSTCPRMISCTDVFNCCRAAIFREPFSCFNKHKGWKRLRSKHNRFYE